MHFNVSQLLNEPSGSSRRLEVSESIVRRFTAEELTLTGGVTLLRTDRGIWVSGNLESNITCDCSRCLRRFHEVVVIRAEEEFFPKIDPSVGYDTHVVGDKFWIDTDHILDLDNIVAESLEMSIPMKPICKAGCKGLCPVCGIDLNYFKCECDNQARDERWAPLFETNYSPKANVK